MCLSSQKMTASAASPAPTIISVEAAIASGKSTLLSKLKEQFGDSVYIIPEPIGLWQAVGGDSSNNILQKFYTDQARWSYSFQSYVFLTRVNAVEEAIETLRKEGRLETTVIVVERSYVSDKETFGQMLRDSGDINELEWQMYENWWNYLVEKAPKFSGHVYMRTSVDTVMERLNVRNRGEESGLPREYQEQLIEKHEQWVRQAAAPVCALDCNTNFKSDEKEWEIVCNQMSAFFLSRCQQGKTSSGALPHLPTIERTVVTAEPMFVEESMEVEEQVTLVCQPVSISNVVEESMEVEEQDTLVCQPVSISNDVEESMEVEEQDTLVCQPDSISNVFSSSEDAAGSTTASSRDVEWGAAAPRTTVSETTRTKMDHQASAAGSHRPLCTILESDEHLFLEDPELRFLSTIWEEEDEDKDCIPASLKKAPTVPTGHSLLRCKSRAQLFLSTARGLRNFSCTAGG